MVESSRKLTNCDQAYADFIKALDKKQTTLFSELATIKTPTTVMKKIADAVAILLSKQKGWTNTSKMFKDSKFGD